jgi:hypothetical protein
MSPGMNSPASSLVLCAALPKAMPSCTRAPGRRNRTDKDSRAEEPWLNIGTRTHQQAHKESARERPFSGVSERRQSPPSPVLCWTFVIPARSGQHSDRLRARSPRPSPSLSVKLSTGVTLEACLRPVRRDWS